MSNHPRRAIYADIIPSRFPPKTSAPAPTTSTLLENTKKMSQAPYPSRRIPFMESEDDSCDKCQKRFQDAQNPYKLSENPFAHPADSCDKCHKKHHQTTKGASQSAHVDTEEDNGERKDSTTEVEAPHDTDQDQIYARFARHEDTRADREYIRNRLVKAAYRDGFENGFAGGKEEGQTRACEQCYDRGRDDGFRIGRDNGFHECDRRLSAAQNKHQIEKERKKAEKEEKKVAAKKDRRGITGLFKGNAGKKRDRVDQDGYRLLGDGDAEVTTNADSETVEAKKKDCDPEQVPAKKQTVRPVRRDASISPYWFA